MTKIENLNNKCTHDLGKIQIHYGVPTPVENSVIYTSINHPAGIQAFGTCECLNCGKTFTLIGDNVENIVTLQNKNKLNLNDYLAKEKNSDISEYKRKL